MTGHLNFVFTFQLTPSRRATDTPACALRNFDISTHALTEGDVHNKRICKDGPDFNSRPHGGRPFYFNSRPHGGRQQI